MLPKIIILICILLTGCADVEQPGSPPETTNAIISITDLYCISSESNYQTDLYEIYMVVANSGDLCAYIIEWTYSISGHHVVGTYHSSATIGRQVPPNTESVFLIYSAIGAGRYLVEHGHIELHAIDTDGHYYAAFWEGEDGKNNR